VKKIQEEESGRRMNRIAAALEEKNDFKDAGIKIFEYPIPRLDGRHESQVINVKVVRGSRIKVEDNCEILLICSINRTLVRFI